jgi:hypothetical protein
MTQSTLDRQKTEGFYSLVPQGRYVNPSVLREKLGKHPILGDTNRNFLRVFESRVDIDSLVGIEHGDFWGGGFLMGEDVVVQHYLVGDSNVLNSNGEPYEVTLRSGNMKVRSGPLMGSAPILQIGINYDSRDRDIKLIEDKVAPTPLPRKGLLQHTRIRGPEIKQPSLQEKFPLYDLTYGARVRRDPAKDQMLLEINDERLADLAMGLYAEVRS